MKPVRRLLHLCLWLALALAGFAPRQAAAQLSVTLTLNKTQYVAFEPILATVTIANRAGKDIVLGETDGRPWLTFNVGVNGGEALGVYAGEPRPEPRVLPAGRMWQETVSLGRHWPLGGSGTYYAKASVYFNELRQFHGSNTRTFTVMDGVKAWEDQVGVPRPSGKTDYRRYTILTFHEEDRMSLYVRVRDERSQRVIATYSVGRLVPFRDVQPTVDGDGRLHVLFLTGPKLYRHVTVDPDGEKLGDELYENEAGSVPQLRIANTGRVRVAGGRAYDATRAHEIPREVIRSLSERPPGMPDESVE